MVLETEAGDADKYDQQGGEAREIADEERAPQGARRDERCAHRRERAHRLARAWHRAGRLRLAPRGGVRHERRARVEPLAHPRRRRRGRRARDHRPDRVRGPARGRVLDGGRRVHLVASQRDLLARQVELEKREIAEAPEEEAAELTLIFKQKGLSTEQASRTAAEILKNPDSAADTLVREELGLDPDDLGSPMGAAVASFALFSVGALVPVLPFLLTSGTPAIAIAASLAGALLATVGGLLGFLSGTSVLHSAARMVGLAAVAAGVTYGVGRLFGATVS